MVKKKLTQAPTATTEADDKEPIVMVDLPPETPAPPPTVEQVRMIEVQALRAEFQQIITKCHAIQNECVELKAAMMQVASKVNNL